MRILYLTAEEWPTYRSDLTVLFGKYLPRLGVYSDLVTASGDIGQTETAWPGGNRLLCSRPSNRALQYVIKFYHQAKVLIASDYSDYDAIQVRDMALIALVAVVVAKFKSIPFYYWLSYPQSEGQIHRAKARGMRAGMRFWFPLLQGYIGQWLVYKLIMPHANHVFVQSQTMLEMVAQRGIARERMTPVPMGVDIEALALIPPPIEAPFLKGKRVLVYLGTLDRVRKIELLFEMLALLKASVPNVLLVIVGDTEDEVHGAWLKEQAIKLGVNELVFWTGWLPMQTAWSYVLAAEIGLSPVPRGYLLDMGSPTKAIEYMALGLPVVMNDNPDQYEVANTSGAGLCVPLNAHDFAAAVLALLNSPDKQQRYQLLGRTYVTKERSYEMIAQRVAAQYQKIQA